MKQETKELYYKIEKVHNDLSGIDLLLSGHDRDTKVNNVISKILIDINTLFEEIRKLK
tara:strand:+ start:573 stop:746 length:174 start_codon:yes stop_codon:yes gene_type:complete